MNKNIVISVSKNHATIDFIEPIFEPHFTRDRFNLIIYSNAVQNIQLRNRFSRIVNSNICKKVRYFAFEDGKVYFLIHFLSEIIPFKSNFIFRYLNKILSKWSVFMKIAHDRVKKYRIYYRLNKDKPDLIMLENSLVLETVYLNKILVNYSKKKSCKLVILPHAPHKGKLGYSKIPYIDEKLRFKVDYWMANSNEYFLGDNKDVYNIFFSGYPLFDENCVANLKSSILKKTSGPDLVVFLRETKENTNNYFHMTFEQAGELLSVISRVCENNGFTNMVIKPHPSINLANLETLIGTYISKDINVKISFDALHEIVSRRTIVIGSYTTIFLSAYLLNIRSYLINDVVLKNLKSEARHIFDFYSRLANVVELDDKLISNKISEDAKVKYDNESYLAEIHSQYNINSISICQERIVALI
jgi:hypothetical protein